MDAVYVGMVLGLWLATVLMVRALAPDSAFNTAVSFVSNTNWQGYSGESTMGYLTQMLALAVQNFFSAATGIAVVFAVFLVGQGVIQNLEAYKEVSTLEVTQYQSPKLDASGQPVQDAKGVAVQEDAKTRVQTLPKGPVASQEAIKMLGTNGGGSVDRVGGNCTGARLDGARRPFRKTREILQSRIAREANGSHMDAGGHQRLGVRHLEPVGLRAVGALAQSGDGHDGIGLAVDHQDRSGAARQQLPQLDKGAAPANSPWAGWWDCISRQLPERKTQPPCGWVKAHDLLLGSSSCSRGRACETLIRRYVGAWSHYCEWSRSASTLREIWFDV